MSESMPIIKWNNQEAIICNTKKTGDSFKVDLKVDDNHGAGSRPHKRQPLILWYWILECYITWNVLKPAVQVIRWVANNGYVEEETFVVMETKCLQLEQQRIPRRRNQIFFLSLSLSLLRIAI
jgi:hypothetical protein